MKIYLYIKSTEDIELFDPVIDAVRSKDDEIYMSVEGRRIFRELDSIVSDLLPDDVVIVSSLTSLGLTDADIANRLDWFISHMHKLVICSYPGTYQYGLSQPVNQAVLTTILQAHLGANRNIIQMPKNRRSNSGRSKTIFPDNWEELYQRWSEKEISSKEFLTATGLKKATFYNLLAEYKSQQAAIQKYMQRHKEA